MNSTKVFWKQPLLYLFMLVAGASGAMFLENRIEQNSSASAPTAVEPMVEATPEVKPQTTTVQANSASWFGSTAGLLNANSGSNFIVAAVEQVGPAVVRINAERRSTPSGFDRFDRSQEDFFGFGFPRRGREMPSPSQQQPVEQGTGSGFILTSDGQIITNAHVVEGASVVQVVLKDGRRFEGRVLGTDEVTDVAVIKIDVDNLPTVPLGNSEELSPGEWAIAIGNPLGLDNSVTVGIISATGRSSSDVGVPDKRIGFIQTDAAINPGNSGGPLLNGRGEVIGMNTAIISGAQGLGFAIPINKARQIAQQLATSGRAQHAYLGIEMITLTPEVARQLDNAPDVRVPITEEKGVLVVNVIPNSPAAQSGLRAGDVILKMDGQTIRQSETVQQVVQNKNVGSPVNVEISREGRTQSLEVRTGPLPTTN
ncbi:MAG: HhoA/HhoB/HtrA family serine endopeptidase [Microcoleaceae cyanobacterium]